MRGAARGALTALMLAMGVLADDTTPPPSSFPTHFPTTASPTVSPTRFPTTLSPTRKKCYEVREGRWAGGTRAVVATSTHFTSCSAISSCTMERMRASNL